MADPTQNATAQEDALESAIGAGPAPLIKNATTLPILYFKICWASLASALRSGFFGYVLILIVATLRTSGPIGLVDQQTKKNPFMDG
jgi:hypothetical protein